MSKLAGAASKNRRQRKTSAQGSSGLWTRNPPSPQHTQGREGALRAELAERWRETGLESNRDAGCCVSFGWPLLRSCLQLSRKAQCRPDRRQGQLPPQAADGPVGPGSRLPPAALRVPCGAEWMRQTERQLPVCGWVPGNWKDAISHSALQLDVAM